MNFLDGTLQKSGDQYTVDLAGTTIPLPKEKTADGKLDAYVGKTLKVGIRPEDIKDDEEFLENASQQPPERRGRSLRADGTLRSTCT